MTAPDLRTRLVEAGVALLGAEGPDALTLRSIARHAGVSHGAPRRHFPTHRELLSAIARKGFDDLAAAVGLALRDGGTPRARLAALATAYVEFARAEPGMFALMFRHDLLASGTLGLRERSLPLFGVLEEAVAQNAPDAARDPGVTAAALWANLHGIAQLWSWGSLQLATELDDVAPLVAAALDAHLGPADGAGW
ncbi:TetR/AcrR family transcriptional regulator [Streptomyces sp. NPDC060194]|uniref:TetR/AcrR family transcriptional regulator n=1 Tax=Streptomyces sp. NPDC060194 TaxID=3347069 RepID=UPI003664CB88